MDWNHFFDQGVDAEEFAGKIISIDVPASRCTGLKHGEWVYVFKLISPPKLSVLVGKFQYTHNFSAEPGRRVIGGLFWLDEPIECEIRPTMLQPFDHQQFIAEKNRPRFKVEDSGPLKDRYDFRVRIKGEDSIRFL